MREAGARIRISDLTILEQRELIDALPAGHASARQAETLAGGQHGDPSTWQVVIDAYIPALPVLAAWLLKRRKKSVVEVEVESSDGVGWERRSVRVEIAEQSAPDVDVLRQLTGLMHTQETQSPQAHESA